MSGPVINTTGRHPSVKAIARWFEFRHLDGPARNASEAVFDLAEHMIDSYPDSTQLTAGLWDLLHAKDCFVRCAIEASETA